LRPVSSSWRRTLMSGREGDWRWVLILLAAP